MLRVFFSPPFFLEIFPCLVSRNYSYHITKSVLTKLRLPKGRKDFMRKLMVSRLTLLDKQVGEGEHDCVAAVQEVTTHDVGTGDGQASSGDQPQNSL